MVFQLICWWVSYTFVLASSSRTCEEDLSEVPYFVLNGCQFSYAVLCRLVPDCGSAIIRRSSRSPQGFGASPRRLVASNLGRYKAIYPLFSAKLSLFLNLLSWRSGHPCARIYRHLSCGIRAIVVTVYFVITRLSILYLPSVTVFIHHIYLFCHIL